MDKTVFIVRDTNEHHAALRGLSSLIAEHRQVLMMEILSLRHELKLAPAESRPAIRERILSAMEENIREEVARRSELDRAGNLVDVVADISTCRLIVASDYVVDQPDLGVRAERVDHNTFCVDFSGAASELADRFSRFLELTSWSEGTGALGHRKTAGESLACLAVGPLAAQ